MLVKSPPLVTGVSPKEGPPGTRITIRGENLGTDPKDLIGLRICGMDCILFADWKSPSKIVARSGPGKGNGDVIVITQSGGVGGYTVGFRGYFLQAGPLQESAVWTDESQSVSPNLDHGRLSSTAALREDDDPLGISVEGEGMKEDELFELFPESSGNMSLENYSPSWYLLEHHQNARFEDLKAALQHMKRNAHQISEGPISVVRSNLSAIFDCLDSLTRTYHRFISDDIRDHSMDSYAVLLMQAKSCADGLFQEVLGRKDTADSTRNVLCVLSKFRFLFHLPLSIQRNIQRGEYSIVINDFEKATALFADTNVKVFLKVYKDVECRIANFRDMLHRCLLDPSNTLDERKKLISYLTSLGAGFDATWESLVHQQNHLVQLLEACRDDHIEAECSSSLSTSNVSFGRHCTSLRHRQPSCNFSLLSANGNGMQSSTGWRDNTPQKVIFLEELTEVMTEVFPDLWKIGQAYFSGEFNRTREISDKGFKPDTSRHVELKAMISDLVRFFANFVRAAFLPESLENLPDAEREKFGLWPDNQRSAVTGNWLPHCVRTMRSCISTLAGLGITGDSMVILQDLAFDLRTNCMFTLLKQAMTNVKTLYRKQTWTVDTRDGCGGFTQLPVMFDNIVNDTVQHLHEVVVLNRPGESEIFSQRPIQKEATMLCTQLMQAFAHCLEELAYSPPLLKPSHSDRFERYAHWKGKRDRIHAVYGSDDDDGELFPSLDKRLIVMLGDCDHTATILIPRIIDNLDRHGYVEMNKAAKMAHSTYLDLDRRLFESYVEQKSDPIIGAMEPSMYRGGFTWLACPPPAGVRPYLKENVMSVIEVHAEVFSISSKFVGRVIGRVTEAVVEEMNRLIRCVTEFGVNGPLQARLDLMALQDTIHCYSSRKTE